jgi:hypothetical protein
MTSQAAVISADTPPSPPLCHIPLLQKPPLQRPMTAPATVQVEELTANVAAAAAHCAEVIPTLKFRPWGLPGCEICKDDESLKAVTTAMKLFQSPHWKVGNGTSDFLVFMYADIVLRREMTRTISSAN